VLPQKPSLHPLYLLQLFTINIFGGFESLGIVPVLGSTSKLAFTGRFDDEWSEALYAGNQAGARKKAVDWARFMLLFHLGLLIVSIWLQLWLLPLLVTFSPFIGNWLRYFVGVPMHTGLRDNVDDFRLCVRSITLDPISHFLYWRMNWHTEHHMFAAVPCYNLRKLYKAVAWDMPKPRTLFGAWREMRATWKKQCKDPTYQFDTPLP
jgi:fatty acid desaturase